MAIWQEMLLKIFTGIVKGLAVALLIVVLATLGHAAFDVLSEVATKIHLKHVILEHPCYSALVFVSMYIGVVHEFLEL